jgi:hypothetical protein
MIESGEPEVFGKLWLRKKVVGSTENKPRRWVKKLHWHAQRKADGQCCWLVSALAELAKHPHIEKRGRKKLLLPKEQRDERLRLLRKRAKVVQQIKAETDVPPNKMNMDRIAELGLALEELKVKIEPVGGIPKSWM